MKNPLSPAGIEPATFRFVAQHLNHCATTVPLNETEKELNLPLRKTPFGIENIITSEGHRLNIYDSNSFGVVV